MGQIYSVIKDNLGVLVCEQDLADKFIDLYKDEGAKLTFTGNRTEVEDYLGTELEYVLADPKDYF